MKLKRAERLAIAITAVFLLLTAFYRIVTSRPTPPVTVTASKQVQQTAPTRSASENGSASAVNLNTASLDELQMLSGIGPALAQRIVEYREENGPFQSVEEITQVKGIAEKVYSENYDRMTVE